MIMKLRNQPHAPKWEQEEEKKVLFNSKSAPAVPYFRE
jgi:hypothetical protein